MSRELTAYIDEITGSGGEMIASSMRLWKEGVASEVKFWSDWFESKGSEWPDDFNNRLTERAPPGWIRRLYPSGNRAVRILDVGAGPLTPIGARDPDRHVELVAVDPLAAAYSDLYEKYLQNPPPVRTEFGLVEALSCYFEPNRFDIITCNNALDHTVAPVWGLIEMLICLRRGGNIILSHHRNEAEHGKYRGLHQWNIDRGEDPSHMIIWNKAKLYNINLMFGGFCDVKNTGEADGGFLTTIITKTGFVPFDLSQYQSAIRGALLNLMMGVDKK